MPYRSLKKDHRRVPGRCALALASILLAAPLFAQEPWLAGLSDGMHLELPAVDPSIPTPRKILGYELGSRFSHYDRILDYLEALAAASDRVELSSYGSTYEGRPLTLLAISSPENLARLDEIQRRARKLASPTGLEDEELERLLAESPVVVWLAYGVHGNESSSSESAMAAAYQLAAAQGELAEHLDEAVVLLDPLSNPDGRERYVNGYRQRRGLVPDPDPAAAEHREPWPGGRQNHYLIDLNRDWAWATQRETRDRLAAYRAWEPQVYVDFHEMSARSTYFFPPAAEPIHPRIDRRIVSWLEVFGRANAAAFDQRGWTYYKAENFDLFYPGYGDSYPSLRGTVGMTYEMAGGGRAGQTIELPDGRRLNLADRIARHLTTSIATVETAARSRRALLAGFVNTRLDSLDGEATTFLWRAEDQEAGELARLFELHGVEVRRLERPTEIQAEIQAVGGRMAAAKRTFSRGDYLVSTRQPLGSLARVLLELDAPMTREFVERQRRRLERGLDPEFYDITAWSLPLAYNLVVWKTGKELAATSPLSAFGAADTGPAGIGSPGEAPIEGSGGVGCLIAPRGLATYAVAARLGELGIHYRLALASFETEGQAYDAGTLFVPYGGNPPDLDRRIEEIAGEKGVPVRRVSSSYTAGGISLGSERMLPIRPARIALVRGEGIRPTSFGALWHLLDREIRAPYSLIDLADLGGIDLGAFDVLILPDGFRARGGDEEVQKLKRWLEGGGMAVAMGSAVSWLREHELTKIEEWTADPAAHPAGEPETPGTPGRGAPGDAAFATEPLATPGAAVATEMLEGHPLTVGLRSPPAVMVLGSTVLLPTGKVQQDVLTALEDSPVVAGFAWPEAESRLAGSLLMGVEKHGEGRLVVFAHNPAFRLFWRATMPLFLNTVMYGPSLSEAGRF